VKLIRIGSSLKPYFYVRCACIKCWVDAKPRYVRCTCIKGRVTRLSLWVTQYFRHSQKLQTSEHGQPHTIQILRARSYYGRSRFAYGMARAAPGMSVACPADCPPVKWRRRRHRQIWLRHCVCAGDVSNDAAAVLPGSEGQTFRPLAVGPEKTGCENVGCRSDNFFQLCRLHWMHEMQNIVTQWSRCLSVSLSVTRLNSAAWRRVECGVIRCSLCQITLASCSLFYYFLLF